MEMKEGLKLIASLSKNVIFASELDQLGRVVFSVQLPPAPVLHP
jgi:hypothetical protein